MRVHQLLSGAGPVDAVTGQARAYRRLFREWGWGGTDAAERIDPRVGKEFVALRRLEPEPGDILLIHYSAHAPKLRPLLGLPNRKLLVSHNVTPARYLWGYEPMIAVHCALGRAQLPEFAQAADLAAGVSEYNAAELREAGARKTTVIPILFDRSRLGPTGSTERSGPPMVLFVGRLAPHKRQDDVIRAFGMYREHRAPDALLVLVGEPITPRYERALRDLANETAPGAVTFESGIDSDALAERYHAAHVFLCLSEHEGFCVPLLEAFHYGVPVIARPAGGIPEVAGDAALLLEEHDDLAVVAELLHIAVTETDLRAGLRAAGEQRLEAFSYERTAHRLREALESLV